MFLPVVIDYKVIVNRAYRICKREAYFKTVPFNLKEFMQEAIKALYYQVKNRKIHSKNRLAALTKLLDLNLQ